MSAPTVTIAQGTLSGKVLVNENGKEYHGFCGIPYAAAPVGKLRFRPPQKPESWSGVRQATEQGSECSSKHMLLQHPIGTEDCLFANVYIPQTDAKKPLPVMFWVHGGDFVMGSGNTDMYGPDYLMDYDVILVTFNYRLGILGFLNLDLEECPGNVGLMDQVAALKWTKQNIAKFGGDPNNITIFGESAGGASVHYLVLSDTTRGLFQKAIAQSGSALNPWAFQRHHLKNAFRLCEALGHPTTDTKDALKFLQTVPVDDFVNIKIPPLVDGQLVSDFVFVPSLEKRYSSHEPFLAELPVDKMLKGDFNKVPFMTGITDAEGILAFMDFAKDPAVFDKFENDFERFVPTDLQLPLRSEASVKLAKEMKQFYFRDQPVSENTRKEFVDVVTDCWFVRGVNDHVKLMSAKTTEPIYYYEYNFDEYGFLKNLVGIQDVKGACHADELGYLFKNELSQFPKELESAVVTQKRLLSLWTNFAKTGNPTPSTSNLLPVKWLPATKDQLVYLSIGKNLEIKVNPMKERIQFWERATKKDYLSRL
ncbi:esterase FE4-like [Ctenocephalides felis]|uniref:esterase FE4-like n=1 Tax=Ctenocephalides felis TaxID=7515 RepID=UPI000E6E5A50|nr:esterase FE4-like [Ctenocephalides felis]